MGKILFIRDQGGLGTPLPGEDYISGLLAFPAAIPAAFNGGVAGYVQVFSEEEVIDAGLETDDADAEIALIAYAAKMFFQMNPKGVLWLGLKTGGLDFEEIPNMQRNAEGKIRQIGVVTTDDLTTNMVDLAKVQREVCVTEDMPLEVVIGANTADLADYITDLPNLANLLDDGVAVVIGQDGGSLGKEIFDTIAKSVPAVGAVIGVLSSASVHENIGWVQRFNIALNDTVDFDVCVLGDGVTKVKELAPSALTTLDNKRYIYIRKHFGIGGSYFNDSFCACAVTSDYQSLELNRTINKAVRGIRINLVPSINSPLYVNEDGTLTEDTIQTFRNSGRKALEQMEVDGELSKYDVIINPAQDVLATSKIVLTAKLVPVGVAREINVKIGFAVKITDTGQ